MKRHTLPYQRFGKNWPVFFFQAGILIFVFWIPTQNVHKKASHQFCILFGVSKIHNLVRGFRCMFILGSGGGQPQTYLITYKRIKNSQTIFTTIRDHVMSQFTPNEGLSHEQNFE